MRQTARTLAALLRYETRPSPSDPADYCIVQGLYKGRKIVCRLSSFSPSKFFRYDLRLHIHIEPLNILSAGTGRSFYTTQKSQLEASDKINYERTSLTTIKSYFFPSMIAQEEFIQIFEELTRAAEIAESNG